MRRNTSFLGMLLLLLWLPLSAIAQEVNVQSVSQLAKPVAQASGGEEYEVGTIENGLKLYSGKLIAPTKIDMTSSKDNVSFAKKAKRQVAASTSDLAGTYVWTSSSLTYSGTDGRSVIISARGTDSILIENVYLKGVKMKAAVNLSTKTLTIPNQVVYEDTINGQYDIAAFKIENNAAVVDRSTNLTGKINDDGTLTIDNNWGIFVVQGTNKDKYSCAFYNTEFERTNGNFFFTLSGNSYYIPAVIKQTSKNTVTVKNFAGYGHTIEILLNRNMTATIANQVAAYSSAYGNLSTIGVTGLSSDGKLYKDSILATITCNKATDGKKISWGNWSLLGTNAFMGLRTAGWIVPDDITFSYPTLSVTDFEGKGTKEDPYLIKKLDDLILLSDNVNNSDLKNGGNATIQISRAYLGSYFKMANDIDMENYRFTPIGYNYVKVFGGYFDGGNHTISNLNVSANGYAGLFGRIDTTAIVSNLNISNATISSTSSFNGAIAGWCNGTIDNCHVGNSTVSGSGSAVGGIGGTVDNIINSNVNNTTITGLGGYVGGVTGETSVNISDCFATETTVNGGGSEGLPVGGVVGNLYKATAKNCYFTGTVNGTTPVDDTYSTNLEVGGIFGRAYGCTIDRCFSKANILGYDSKANVGGVVGTFIASQLTNSYATGRVQSSASKLAGGITGRVLAYTIDGTLIQPVIKNCYTAGTIDAETYQYNPDTEYRETLGTVDEGTTPVLSNIYFDNQIGDLKSTHYGVATTELTKGAGPDGFTTDQWVFTEGQYPRIKGMDNTEAAKYSASSIILYTGNSIDNVAKSAELHPLGNTVFKLIKNGNLGNDGHFSTISNNQLVLNDYGVDTLYVINGKDFARYFVKIAPVSLEGSGTSTKPYLIKTKADMILLANLTTNKSLYFPNTYFKIANDIDMEHDTNFNGLCNNPNDAHSQFEGTLDGDGHTLHNLSLTGYVKWTTQPTTTFGDGTGEPLTGNNGSKGYNGLICRLATTGVVKNLTIAADANFEFWATAGSFVGYNYGLVENCKNYAKVPALSCWVGGIAGYNLKEGIIRNCYNEGNVISGYQNAGGIVGSNSGTVENSMNVGTVEVRQLSTFQEEKVAKDAAKMKFAGGIAGSSNGAVYKNVLNAGTVYAYYANAGGITGSLPSSSTGAGANDVSNAINYGAVLTSDQSQIGAIGGSNGTTGTIKNTYWDSQIVAMKAAGNGNLNGAMGVETSVLTSGKQLNNFSEDLWSFEENKYPVLKAFKDEALVNNMRSVIVSIAAGENAADLKSNITLLNNGGATFKLKQGNWFTLSEKTVTVPANVEKLTVDTLIETIGNYVKPIILKKRYPMPVAGDGTKESPYLITNAKEWDAVANYMTNCGTDFVDKYIKIANDINFADTTFVPMGVDHINFIQCDFDGNKKTVKGITYKTADIAEGAFITVGDNAYIHDLTLEGKITAGKTYAAGFVGSAYGKFENCTNNISVTSTFANTAGFAAYAYGASRFINCLNSASVSSSAASVAGFASDVREGANFENCGNTGTVTNSGTASYTAGFCSNSAPAHFKNVFNTGDIKISKTTSVTIVAGIIANAQIGSDSTFIDMKGCYNTAAITAKGNVAGLLTAASNALYVVKMDSCYNTGDIVAAATTATTNCPTAGLASFYTAGSQFTNCWNSGTIMSEKNVYTAGIVGDIYNVAKKETPIIITNCHNSGDIVASGNQGAGIVAYTNKYTTINNCYNTGNIEGGFGLGGIIGGLQGDTTDIVSNCYNLGNITTSTNRTGGVIGYGVAEAKVSNCFNLGDVATSCTNPGTQSAASKTVPVSGYAIGGLAGTTGATFINCYNLGTVTGASQVGGLVGAPRAGSTKFYNCYNAGKIVAAADTCGAIIGTNVNYFRNWSSDNIVENTYYISDFGKYNNVVGEETTLAALCSKNLGEDWTNTDAYSLPIIKTYADSSFTKFYSAVIVPHGTDTYQNITGNFYVGAPAGLLWTPSVAVMNIAGNNATFSNSYTGELVMTATMGKLSKQFTLNCDVSLTDINRINGKEIKDEKYYNATGVQVMSSEVRNGQVYIIKRTYTDGTSQTIKITK